MAKTTKLVLTGGRKPQQRKANAKSWSTKKAAEFLSVLGETCNVSEACRQSGVSSAAAYARRKSDAAFRAGWNEALSTSYRRLELVLLERAFNGTEKLIKRRDGSEELMTEYSDQLGLTLLKLHRATVAEAEHEPTAEEADEVRARIIAKLKRLRKRFEAADAAAEQAGE